ncbi:MAG: HAD family phosphatase [Acidobacteriota bacterium]
MIKTILFDLGQVIIPFDVRRAYAALASHCPHPPDQIRARVASTDMVRRFEEGHLSPEDFVAQFSRLLELHVSYARFCELWSSIFLPETLVPESLVEALGRRYRMLVLSNTNAIHFEMVRENYPLLRHFDDYILSYRVGALKPAPQIYQEAIRRAGCEPQECFFTDDIPQYVEAAREQGIDAVRFESAVQLEEELRRRGIEW